MANVVTSHDKRVAELCTALGFSRPCAKLTIEFEPDNFVRVHGQFYAEDEAMDKLVEIFKEGKFVEKEN